MQGSFQCVHQEKLSPTLALQRSIDSHSPQQRDWKRKPRQLVGHIARQFASLDGMSGERIETSDGMTIGGENEDCSQFALLILAGPLLKVGIKFGDTTAKACSIMIRIERLDSVFGRWRLACHYLTMRCL